ncbi:MAG: HhH-GPD-type base excision DNA repair protein [Acidimicrobiales bacterium]
MAKVELHLTGDPDADALLSRDPLALLIGMVLDQQVPMERAFSAPLELARRMGGSFTASDIASMDPEKFAALFKERPALHRFPGSMAERVQAVCRIVAEEYGGQASAVWKRPADGDDLIGRLTALPGFGPQKARIFAALLGKQLGVQPPGWQSATKPFGDPGTSFSIADITDAESLGNVRAHKQAMKAKARAKG